MTYYPPRHTTEYSRELSDALDEAIEIFQRLQDARATPGAFMNTLDEDGELCRQLEASVRALGFAVLDYIWCGGELRLAGSEHHDTSPPPAPPRFAPTQSASPDTSEVTRVEAVATPPPEPPAQKATQEEVREEVALEEDVKATIVATPERAPCAPRAEITPEVLARLQASLEQRATPEESVVIDTVDEGWLHAAKHIDALASQLGKPGAFKSRGAVKSELGVLRKHTTEDAIADWGNFPDEVRLVLSHFVAARCRALQEAPKKYRKGLDLKEEVAEIFPRLRAPLERERLGFVHGLALDHRPAHGSSWRDDVEHWSRALGKLRQKYAPRSSSPQTFDAQKAITALMQLVARKASPVAIREDLQKYIERGLDPRDERVLSTLESVAEIFPEDDPRWSRLHAGWEDARRRELEEDARDEQGADARAEEDACSEPPPVDERWSHWAYIAGRTVAIIGGDRREAATDRIGEVFMPAKVIWPKVTKRGGMRRVTSMCSRIDNHSIELVIILNRFISHKASNKIIGACKKAGVPYACIEKGYGVASMAEAIERFLPPHPIYLANAERDGVEEE